MKAKLGTKTVHTGQQQVKLVPIEDSLNLVAPFRMEVRNRSIAGFLLQKSQQDFCFQFAWDCQGIHPTPRLEQIHPIFEALESGLKDLPQGERLTLQLSSFSSDRERQEQLKALSRSARNPQLQFLLLGERQRVQELTRQGQRKPKRLRLYATYTVTADSQGATDAIEKVLLKLENWINKLTGEFSQAEQQKFEALFTKAFTDGFQVWEQLLIQKMGLDLRPLDEAELWQDLWFRFNTAEPIPIPQLLILDRQGLREEVNSPVHATTLLLGSESSVPIAQRHWVNLKQGYIAALTFLDKPGGWADQLSQLRYLWEVLARESVTDVEVFCQLSRANEMLVKTSVQRVTKQSNVAALVAHQKAAIDVGAQLKTQEAVAAQEELYRGALPLHTAVSMLVYRPHLDALDEACRYLQGCFRRPAWVLRETEYAWRIWLQTLPIVWEGLLTSPFNRRQVYLSSEAPGLLPLMRPQDCDRTGFELITEEGGVPIHLDLFTAHKNLGLFATTRAGKSVLVSGILTQALSHGLPVVAMDFPKPDGSSTFTDYTAFMGEQGAYFDIGNQSNNLFEMPDLRALSLSDQRERFEDYKGFLESALMTMILGSGRTTSGHDRLLAQTIRSIIVLALNGFFQDSAIDQRYRLAMEGGFASDAWIKTPTLADFLDFCTPERLDLEQIQGENSQALQQIRLRLRFWLNSRVGRSISAPSSFRTDAQLLVFALRNLSSDEDAAVLSLSAYSAALRRALQSPASIFFIDEAPILFEFDEISALVARLCANGAKAGVRVILSGQDPDTIARSPSASKILQNLTTRLIGRIQPSAIDSFEQILKYPREIIARNASESFFPRRAGMYSQWLLDDAGLYTTVRYYPSEIQLAAVANNPHEQAARTAYLQACTDPLEGLARFAKALAQAIREDRPIAGPEPE
ncbi:hypothetical protein BST81_11920 [Leptolyngbya sp. 'hensonii']|uniref:hypothetical protein n=1 Tax=Leptolyngbya sp. 'hensonii' TaxID=1922337 RepID=UPI00094FD32C|nr:hypothetical protein [Leptolyngbya sp. 'hensonii']OLP17776.1 hypothetical protein BST81_11920 [Leptolyngbya sp. 'hensonii']